MEDQMSHLPLHLSQIAIKQLIIGEVHFMRNILVASKKDLPFLVNP